MIIKTSILEKFQALGNHEFDDGITGLANFLRGFTVTVVSANLNSDAVPVLQGQYSYSTVIRVGGRDIGLIGYLTQVTKELVLPGKKIVLNGPFH